LEEVRKSRAARKEQYRCDVYRAMGSIQTTSKGVKGDNQGNKELEENKD
jgi:hypothetical protein